MKKTPPPRHPRLPGPPRPRGDRKRKLRVGSAAYPYDPSYGRGNPVYPAYEDDPYNDFPGDFIDEQWEERRRGPLVIPRWWLNTVVGLFLLPIAGIWTKTFFHIFSHETIHNSFWATEEFWFFFLGIALWLITFFGLPRPLLIYVFGHELTHAVWVWLMGGRVSEFKVAREGGHIMTNRHNVLISLAPYFYPIYSVAIIILYGVAALFWDVAPYTRWLFLALGITWAFHITFTFWMIPKGQSDLTYHGTFYSLVVIYIMNIALLTGLGLVAAPHATFLGFAREFLHNTSDFSGWLAALARHLLAS